MADLYDAAAAIDVEEGRILALDINDTPVALTRLNGVVYAFGDVCTHDDGPLADGDIADMCVVCPRHGATFDLRTGAPTFPAAAPILVYEAVEDGDRVKVKM